MKRLIGTIVLLACACGGGTEEPVDELGTLSIGGKADDPVTQIDVRVQPGREKVLRFDAAGDLTISLFQRDARAKALMELVDRDPAGAGDVVYRNELGREGEPMPADSPSLEVSDAEGTREYELTVHNVDDEGWLDAKIVFSQPVETECLSYERPDHWFEPLARCTVIAAPKLEDESTKEIQSVDFCVGRGQVVDYYNPDVRHDTLHVIGSYSYSDPEHNGDTFTGKLRDPVRLDESDPNTLHASTRRSQEVVSYDTTLMGPEEEREFREFEYIYSYDIDATAFEFRVKSRPSSWPNWYWEFAMQLECSPIQ